MLIYHIDMNSVALRGETLRDLVHKAASFGYDAILWEVEDKIRWESWPGISHPDALSKAEFRAILSEAADLGLEAIPLMQAFGHGEYILEQDAYRSLCEVPGAIDCYCVSKPETTAFLKGLLHEYLDLFGPVRFFHLGGEETAAFGTCPLCARRNRTELFIDHLDAVSGELREKGIRPCFWHDMLLADPDLEALAKLPRDSVVFYWDYEVTDETVGPCEKTLDLLKGLGLAVVLCGTVQSWGEDPFIGAFRHHADNCTALARLVADRKLPGLAVTSWSIQGAPKIMQVPVMDLAARCYRGAAPFETLRARIREEYLGCADLHLIHDLMACPPGLFYFTSIGWTGYKDARPPTKEQAERFLDEGDPEMAALKRAMAAELPGALERFQASRKALCRLSSRTLNVSYLLRGAELKEFFLRCMVDVLRGRPLSRATVEAMRSSTEAYYAKEQTRSSARRFSEIVWGIFLHLAR